MVHSSGSGWHSEAVGGQGPRAGGHAQGPGSWALRSEGPVAPVAGEHGDLVLELLAELQGDGEEDQGVIEPGDHTLHLVHVAHLQTLCAPLKHGPGAVEHSASSRAEVLGGVGLQGVQLVHGEAELVEVDVEIDQQV